MVKPTIEVIQAVNKIMEYYDAWHHSTNDLMRLQFKEQITKIIQNQFYGEQQDN